MQHLPCPLFVVVKKALLCGAWMTAFCFCQLEFAQAEVIADAKADYQAALALIRQQRYPQALIRLQPYTRDPLQYPLHMSDYIVTLYWSGQTDTALQHFETLPADFPRRDYLLLNMGNAYQGAGKPKQAVALYGELLQRGTLDAAALQAMAKLPEQEQQVLLTQAQQKVATGAAGSEEQLIVLTRLFQGDAAALDAMRKYRLKPENFAQPLALQLAWACVSQRDGVTALEIYRAVLRRAPDNFEARNGRIYALALTRQYKVAQTEVQRLEQEYPGNLKVLYSQAYLFEQQHRFMDAIQVYERMLTISPGNAVVNRLRIRAFSDMGASLHALEEARQLFPEDEKLQASILGDYALDTIAWEEPGEAVAIYNSLNASPVADKRFLFDELYALGKSKQHARVVERYEALFDAHPGIKVPYWTKSSVAASYLHMEKPEQALKLYEEALENEPRSRIALQGQLDTLVELRKWNRAARLRDAFDKQTPDYVWLGKNKKYSDDQLTLDINRGWALMYENRLRDAEAYWQQLYEKAPANLEIRNGRAHLHSWRGWPRQAEEDFNIVASMDPNYKASKPGRIVVKNALADKESAREEAMALYKQQPHDKWTQILIRELVIEEKNSNRLESNYIAEDDGSRDWRVRDEADTPLSLYTRLQAMYAMRRTWNDEDDDSEAIYLRRAGLGLNHIFNRDWSARQMFSVSTEDGKEFGSTTEVGWTPDDHWRVEGLYDSFSTDVAHRARRNGVTAKKAELSADYRESEWRKYRGNISRQFYSDDNERDELNLGYEQNLFVKNDWRMRVFAELYGSRNSAWDNPAIDYYNPKYVWSASLTNMTEQTLIDIYEDYFAHRLYITLGMQKQCDYKEQLIHAIKYEHEYTFSHTNALVWNIEYRDTYYDDDRTGSFAINLIWNMRF